MTEKIEEVLAFWFGPIIGGFTTGDRGGLWWSGNAANDRLITELFGHRVHQALRGELNEWTVSPRGRLALIILLDQFTRTVFRGSEDAFSGDESALALTVEGLSLGHDQALEIVERTFFYMPLEHAEELAIQEKSINCFEGMLLDVSGVDKMQVENWLDFAHQHYDQIKRFGRFPHRNEILGRSSSPEELAFLLQTKTRWGQ